MRDREVLTAFLVIFVGIVAGAGIQNFSFGSIIQNDTKEAYSSMEIVTDDSDLSEFSKYAESLPESVSSISQIPLEEFSNMYGSWTGSPIKYIPEDLMSSRERGAVIVYPGGTSQSPKDGNLLQVTSLPKNSDLKAVMKAKGAGEMLGTRSQCEDYTTTGFVSVMEWNNTVSEDVLDVEPSFMFSTQVNKTKTFTSNSSRLTMDIPDRFAGENVALFGGVSPETVECGFWPHKALEVESLYIGYPK